MRGKQSTSTISSTLKALYPTSCSIEALFGHPHPMFSTRGDTWEQWPYNQLMQLSIEAPDSITNVPELGFLVRQTNHELSTH